MSDPELLTARVIEALNAPTPEAVCLPNDAYTSRSFFEQERRVIFEGQWVFAAVGAQIPSRGDVLPVNVAGWPVLLVRTRSGDVRAFHNVCRHRGLQLVSNPQHGCPMLVCPYHSWTYTLDGELKKTPHFGGYDVHRASNLNPKEYGLSSVRCEMWHDLIFINFSQHAVPLKESMAPLDERWREYDFSLLRHGGSETFEPESNWKLAIENFVESYHLPWTHPGLNGYSRMQAHYNMLEPTYLGQGSTAYDSELAGHPELPVFPGLSSDRRTVAEYPFVMPNLMLGIHPSYLFVFGVQPLAPNRTQEVFHFYFVGDEAMVDDLSEQRQRAMHGWKTVNWEDITMIEGMQRGRNSPGYRDGRFSPYHEVTTHEFQRRLANRFAAVQARSESATA